MKEKANKSLLKKSELKSYAKKDKVEDLKMIKDQIKKAANKNKKNKK